MAKYEFQTEVNQLLKLIIHSLYSNKEIFLRELVSNASDALDKLKYLSVSDEKLKNIAFTPRIDICFDEDKQMLIVRDTGIGMNDEDIKSNLGTIARSGTKTFLEQLAAEDKKDSNLIGQFGVGFYSAFMVSSKIEVISKKAGENSVWKWVSDGKGSYELEQVDDSTFPLIDDVPEGSNGTAIRLFLNQEDSEYATQWKIEDIVQRYSDHIAFPIYLHFTRKEYDEKGQVVSESLKSEQINDASALWQKSKSDLKEDDYKNFYKSLAHVSEDPLLYVHTKAEGTQEYTTLFYIPEKAPFDMFHADYRPGVKLFVKRVFITDDERELLPVYLRFVQGIIDSEDLPLNVSREILQQNRILASIRSASVKKLLGEFKKLAESDAEKYKQFISEFNRPLKEGLYSDYEHRDDLLELVRFASTNEDTEWTSFADYVSRMKEGQKAIYYITGGDKKTLLQSPHLEAYKAKGLEVLIMPDEIDDLVIPTIGKYKDWELKAANRSGSEEELSSEEEKKASEQKEQDFKPVIDKIKNILGESVKEVRISKRLADSPSCVVVDENDPSLQMERMMRAMGEKSVSTVKPILEVNVEHPILKKLQSTDDEQYIADVAFVLLDQALLLEGSTLKDTADFIKRMNKLLSK